MNYKLLAATLKKSFISRKTKFLVAALLLAVSSAFAQVPSYVPTNGLVGWWPFNGNANDESGNGNNGVINGATLTSDRFGSLGSAYYFDGQSNFISTNYFGILGNNDRSVSFWAKHIELFNSTQCASCSRKPVISYGSNIQGPSKIGQGFYCEFNIGLTGVSFDGNETAAAYSTNSPVNDNNWHNYVYVLNNVSNVTSVKIYQDGVLLNTLSYTYLPNFNLNTTLGTSLEFGRRTFNQANPNYYKGSIDEIGFWNRALSQQEITALYNAQSCIGNISADGPTTFCAGNYVNLTSDVVGGTYQWKKNGVNITTNGTSRTYKATATGSYTCVATCNGTALTSNAIQVTTKTNAFASVTASGATSFCLGDSVTLNCTNLGSNYSVQWYRTNISMENATNYSLVVKQPGTYKVVTKNLTTGCSRISGSAITTSVNCRVAGDITSGTTTEENSTNEARFTANDFSQGVNVFPNPNNGTFTFAYDGEETGDGVLQIINTMGQSIYNSAVTIQEGGYTQEIQLGDNYNKGFYIVRLLINGSYHDSRVMVR